jgi:hypothetical protein
MLMQRFPQLSTLFGSPAEPGQPYYAYERLGEEIQQHYSDRLFVQSAGRFIDELALSGDSLLENLLVVSVLEGLAVDPEAARTIRLHIGKEATKMLDEVERDFFGRR